jgi:hypothetical protein
MRSFVLGLIALSFFQSAHCLAQDELKIPLMPRIGKARINDNGKIELVSMKPVTEQVKQDFTVAVPVTENIDGKQVTKMKMENRARFVPVTRIKTTQSTLEIGDCHATDLSNKKIDAGTLEMLLTSEFRLALIITKGETLDPMFQQLFKEGTVVFVEDE